MRTGRTQGQSDRDTDELIDVLELMKQKTGFRGHNDGSGEHY